MKFLEYLEEVRALNLPQRKYAILGSGPLAIRGIRETKDVDLIVTPEIWNYYKNQNGWKRKFAYDVFYLKKGNVELWKRILFFWQRVDIAGFIERAEIIEGLPFVNLTDFISWKKRMHRRKDGRDVLLAEKYLSEHNPQTSKNI